LKEKKKKKKLRTGILRPFSVENVVVGILEGGIGIATLASFVEPLCKQRRKKKNDESEAKQ
jgi:hypothetical protein